MRRFCRRYNDEKKKSNHCTGTENSKKMCLEGRLTIEEAERVFDMYYEIYFTKKSAALFKNLPIREEFSYLK